MRCYRIEFWPSANVMSRPIECRVDPTQRLHEPLMSHLIGEAASRDVLHQSMNQEERPLRVARHQRIGGEIIERLVQVLGLRAGDRYVEEKFGYLFRRQPSKSLEQAPAIPGQLGN